MNYTQFEQSLINSSVNEVIFIPESLTASSVFLSMEKRGGYIRYLDSRLYTAHDMNETTIGESSLLRIENFRHESTPTNAMLFNTMLFDEQSVFTEKMIMDSITHDHSSKVFKMEFRPLRTRSKHDASVL